MGPHPLEAAGPQHQRPPQDLPQRDASSLTPAGTPGKERSKLVETGGHFLTLLTSEGGRQQGARPSVL